MATPIIKVPIVPQWNLVAGCVPTPDDGFLYVASNTINYISQIKSNALPPTMKVFYTRQHTKNLDCDPNWSRTKYFAILAADNSVQVWDFEEGKALYGHKAHFTKPHTEGDGPSTNDSVHMAYMCNRNILSISSSILVIYCVASNTYCRRQRIIPKKHNITILRCSPYSEHIFAAGTLRGLVIVADLKSEQMLYTLKGHDACITSLAWNVVDLQANEEQEKRAPSPSREKQRHFPEAKAAACNDDIFDIYDYDYLENEFGVITDTKQSLEQFEGIEKQQEDVNNSNFNYIEACESIKEEIAALNNKSGCSSHDQQVTLEDCQNVESRGDVSSSCDSNHSVELVERSSTDDSTNKEKLVLQHQAEVHRQEEMKDSPPRGCAASPLSPGKATLLVSAAANGSIWVWNTKTGAGMDQFKGRNLPHGKSNHIEAIWVNSASLLVTSRSGIITAFSLDKTRKGKFKEDKTEFPQQAVISLCRSRTAPLLWTISSHREIICQNLETSQIVAEYGCATTNIVTMRERPDDMNKIAIALSDRRIGIIDISKITPTSVKIDNFTNKIDSQVFALAWGPGTALLAFATNEGRVGILQSDNRQAAPFLFHPVCGKPIYSIDWRNKYIYVCCNEKVALYHDNMQNKDPIVLEYITGASAISVRDKYLFVGTQNGHVEIFKENNSSKISYDLIRSLEICSRYITDIAWSPIIPSRFAVASMSRNILVFNFNESQGTASLERNINIDNGYMTANSCVKWSNRRGNMLLASGFDGAIRVWDLNSQRRDEFFLKQFQCPMTCALFLPSDENVVMCAGRTISIEMFNMLLENTQKYRNIKTKYYVQWGTKIASVDGKTTTEKRAKRRNKATGDAEGNEEDCRNEEEDVSGMLQNLQLDENEKETSKGASCKECKNHSFLKNPTSILCLTTKEINKDCLQKLKQMLTSHSDKERLLTPKLFGTQSNVKRLLEEEIRNQQSFEPNSISTILTCQIASNLQQEVVKRIETKTLTEWHVSLAPSVSYMFWKKCCQAFANQLLEQGHILQAATYMMALHDTKQTVNILLEKQYFKEALIMAKVHCQPDDKIIEEITEKWINYLGLVGNFSSACYIAAASGQLQKAHNILCKTRNITPEINEVLEKIREKTMKI